MKQINCRILSIALIIIIIIVSSFSYSVPVYASHGGGGGINHDREAWIMKDTNTINVEDDGKLMYWIEYIMSQIGVIISDHDISKAMANDQTMKSYIAKGYYDANEDTVTFPQETVTYVYNYIQNHYDEWLPFIIEKTYNMYEIPASTFRTKAAYDAFRSYCSSHHFTVALPQCSVNYMYLADATPYIKDGGAFVSYG
ncbi:MAG: family 2 olfactory receptor, partial [Lachnospiraceae bacterium]|nr:family 2 olfactory receptor [Lachnospiraceae bacterium]